MSTIRLPRGRHRTGVPVDTINLRLMREEAETHERPDMLRAVWGPAQKMVSA